MAEAGVPKPTPEPPPAAPTIRKPRVGSGWLTSLRIDPPPLVRKLLGVACVALVVLAWWATTRGAIEERIISQPSPGEVVGSLSQLMEAGLISHIAASLKRVFLGFGLAIIVGVVFGILAGAWRPMLFFFSPLVLLGRSLPLAALIPLTLFWFGIEDKQKVMFIFIATVPFIFSDAAAAVAIIPERYVETARTLGASRWQIIAKVLVPQALPRIYTSVRFLFGLAFGYIMLAEAINAKAGIGNFINVLQRRGDYASIYMLLFILGLLAYAIDRGLAFFENGIFPYRRGQ